VSEAGQPGTSRPVGTHAVMLDRYLHCADTGLWGGTAGGITGVHEWVFSETPAGRDATIEILDRPI
jgi:hypothetical protein